MKTMLLRAALLTAAVLTGLTGPAAATSSYPFKKGEYVTIASGLSPDKKMSIAANGEGEFGDENFYLYLMGEPAHKVISRISAISSDTVLGSDPKEFAAVWSPDSRHVGINFRQGRRHRDTALFAIRKGRAYPVKDKDLLAVMLGRSLASLNLNAETAPNMSMSSIIWHTPHRFTMEVFREHLVRSRADAEKLLGMLNAYGRIEEYNENLFAVRFSAEAVYEIVNGDEFRLDDIKPGQFKK